MHFKAPHFRQSIGHNVRVGVAVTLFTGAFLLTSGIFTRTYSQTNEKKKGGDTVLLMQTSSGQVYKPFEQAKKDTTKTMDTVPKLIIPDVKTIKYRFPFDVNDSMFTSKDPEVRERLLDYADVWRRVEDKLAPFGLPENVIKSYNGKDLKELKQRWEMEKTSWIVAFLSDKGATPSNALKVHTPEEVKDMLRRWQNLTEIDKKMHELLLKPSIQPHSK